MIDGVKRIKNAIIRRSMRLILKKSSVNLFKNFIRLFIAYIFITTRYFGKQYGIS